MHNGKNSSVIQLRTETNRAGEVPGWGHADQGAPPWGHRVLSQGFLARVTARQNFKNLNGWGRDTLRYLYDAHHSLPPVC